MICPHCEYEYKRYHFHVWNADAAPKVGNLFMCSLCGGLSAYIGVYSLRRLTLDEFNLYRKRPELHRLWSLQKKIKANFVHAPTSIDES